MSEAEGIFEQYETAKWKVGGKEITFAVLRIEELYGNRLAKHKRLHRDNPRIDDMGGDRGWQISALLFNDPDQEGGIDGETQYPDNVNDLCDSFEIHETGTLTLPTRGERRCRAETYRRVEEHDTRDAAAVQLVWSEDNEDDAKVAAFTAPSAKSVCRALAAEAVDACTDVGGWNDDLGSFNDFASDLVGLAEAPGNYVSDLEAKANAFNNKVNEVEKAFATESAKAKDEVETLFTHPEASLAGRRLRELSDTIARMPHEKAIGGMATSRPTAPHTWKTMLSIFDIATELSQDSNELMALNPTLPNMLAIPAGTPVLVYDDAA